MQADKYQELAMRTAGNTLDEDLKEALTIAALGLTGESGEFAELVKKFRYHNHDLDRDKAIKELGDIAWYLARAATALNISLSHVLETNIEKLKKRYPEGFTTEASKARVDVAVGQDSGVCECGHKKSFHYRHPDADSFVENQLKTSAVCWHSREDISDFYDCNCIKYREKQTETTGLCLKCNCLHKLDEPCVEMAVIKPTDICSECGHTSKEHGNSGDEYDLSCWHKDVGKDVYDCVCVTFRPVE